MFKRIRQVNDRINGNVIKIGNRGQRARGADQRPLLNVDGRYVFRLKNGETVDLDVRAQRGALPAVVVSIHGNEVLIPITSLARSIKVNDRGAAIRVTTPVAGKKK